MNNKPLRPLYDSLCNLDSLFVIAPIALIVYYSFFDLTGNFTFDNYKTFLHRFI